MRAHAFNLDLLQKRFKSEKVTSEPGFSVVLALINDAIEVHGAFEVLQSQELMDQLFDQIEKCLLQASLDLQLTEESIKFLTSIASSSAAASQFEGLAENFIFDHFFGLP